LIILVHFFSIWGIFSALSFDFHNNVVAAMLVPWFIYFHELKNKKMLFLFFFLILIAKENMALWLVFIIAGLILKNGWSDKKFFVYQLFLLVFSLCYFIVIVGFVMPYIRDGEGVSQLARYSPIGNSLPEIMTTFFKRPGYIFSLLYENSLGEKMFDGIKMETHWMVVASGGVLLLFRPYYIIMLLPIYAQKMFSNDYVFWGINSQYSIEFVPILSYCLIDFLSEIKTCRISKWISIIVTIVTVTCSCIVIEDRCSLWYDNTNTAFYLEKHYDTRFNLPEIYKALGLIEEKAIVSANAPIVSHLAFREKIYHFPIVKNAEYIVLLLDGKSFYPLKREEYERKVNFYKTSADFSILYDKNSLLILKRIHRLKVKG
ncbi:MAG TPA: DUF2079 domain-containing protein, partial [Cytophagaceae bacterium]|nr:DUF2079 domain-containing protein [Cytophagaceae bacterium]